jgi:hypothetical protein
MFWYLLFSLTALASGLSTMNSMEVPDTTERIIQ